MIITIFINNDINFFKLDLSQIYIIYIHVFFFMFVLYRNLNKTSYPLDSISLENTDLLNEWICEESSIFYIENISWETIKVPLSSLTLDDEKICFDNESELDGNDQLLKCLVGDFPYIPPQYQNLYFYFNDEYDVWFMFFLC